MLTPHLAQDGIAVGQRRPYSSKFGAKKRLRPEVPITSMFYGIEQRRQHDEITTGQFRSRKPTIYPELRQHAATTTPHQGSHPMHTGNQLHRWREVNHPRQMEEVYTSPLPRVPSLLFD